MERVYAATTEGEEAIGAATAETLLQIRGSASAYTRIVRWGCSFDSNTSTDAPAVVRLLIQTTTGTATSCTTAAVNLRNGVAATATVARHFTAEPTASTVLETYEVPVQGGGVNIEYPNDATAPTLDAATSSRIGIEVNSPAACNALAYIHFAE